MGIYSIYGISMHAYNYSLCHPDLLLFMFWLDDDYDSILLFGYNATYVPTTYLGIPYIGAPVPLMENRYLCRIPTLRSQFVGHPQENYYDHSYRRKGGHGRKKKEREGERKSINLVYT
jgi:hypothetical protein